MVPSVFVDPDGSGNSGDSEVTRRLSYHRRATRAGAKQEQFLVVDNGGTAEDSAEPVCRNAPHDEDSDPDMPGIALPPDLDKDDLDKESIAAFLAPTLSATFHRW